MIAMLSVFIFSFCLLSIKPFLEKRKFISPRCFHPAMLINLNLPAESVRTFTPLLVMITLSNGTLLASVTIPFRYITLSHEHKAIPVNAQNIIFRITLIYTYSLYGLPTVLYPCDISHFATLFQPLCEPISIISHDNISHIGSQYQSYWFASATLLPQPAWKANPRKMFSDFVLMQIYKILQAIARVSQFFL